MLHNNREWRNVTITRHSVITQGPLRLAGRCVRVSILKEDGEREGKKALSGGGGEREERQEMPVLEESLKGSMRYFPLSVLMIIVVIKVTHSNCKTFGKTRKIKWKQKAPPVTPHKYNQLDKIIIILYIVL